MPQMERSSSLAIELRGAFRRELLPIFLPWACQACRRSVGRQMQHKVLVSVTSRNPCSRNASGGLPQTYVMRL